MRHFTRISDLGPEGVARILAKAAAWKKQRPGKIFEDRILGMVFFNPSLRTRASFEAAMLRHGGHAIVLEVGAVLGSWKTGTAPSWTATGPSMCAKACRTWPLRGRAGRAHLQPR